MKRGYLVLLVLAAVIIAGCASQTKQKIVMLEGSGATFPQPQLEKWIDVYMSTHKNVKIDYTGKGSGGGQNDFAKGLVDYACSDPPLTKRLWMQLEKKGQPLQFPMIVGAVVVVYNVPGVNNLKLDGKVLADIFMGKIKYWDDAAIAKLNPGVKLPHKEIIVVHRSDASGTTDIFTSYLSLVSPQWNETVGHGKVVNWPVDKMGRGFGGKGNQGVVAIITQTKYSIGYTELSYALREHLKMALIKNKDGYFVEANTTTIKAAISSVGVKVPPPTEGYKEKLMNYLNAPGKDSYPIIAVSHIIVWKTYPNKAKEKAIRDFVTWILTTGQEQKYIVSGYVGLPVKLTKRLLAEAW